jgi:hypothetical protein
MLSKISWSEFIWFLVFLLTPYYLFVLTVFFKKEILAFIRNPALRRGPVSEGATLSEGEPLINSQVLPATSSSDDISLSAIHDLLEDLKNIFTLASKTKMVKEELVQAIYSKLKTYPHLQGSDLQEDIANHIRIEAKDRCGIELTGNDIRLFWQA